MFLILSASLSPFACMKQIFRVDRQIARFNAAMSRIDRSMPSVEVGRPKVGKVIGNFKSAIANRKRVDPMYVKQLVSLHYGTLCRRTLIRQYASNPREEWIREVREERRRETVDGWSSASRQVNSSAVLLLLE